MALKISSSASQHKITGGLGLLDSFTGGLEGGASVVSSDLRKRTIESTINGNNDYVD